MSDKNGYQNDRYVCYRCKKAPVDIWCSKCNFGLCSECSDRIDYEYPPKAWCNHVPLNKEFTVTWPCNQHPSKMLKFWCEDCQERVCGHCIPRQHQCHTIIELSAIEEIKKREQDVLHNEVTRQMRKLEQQAEAMLISRGDTSIEIITKLFRTIRTMLDDHEHELKQKILAIRQKNENALEQFKKKMQEQRNELGEHKDKFKKAVSEKNFDNMLRYHQRIITLLRRRTNELDEMQYPVRIWHYNEGIDELPVRFQQLLQKVKVKSWKQVTPRILPTTRWSSNGVTVAGRKKAGNANNQLCNPSGLFVDDHQAIFIADSQNHRIVECKKGNKEGRVVAGGNGQGNRLDQLDRPTNVLMDNVTDSLIICDQNNRRVVQWSREKGTTRGEILIDNIDCFALAMDNKRYLYVSNDKKHEVRKYRLGEKVGILVAGGNGRGSDFNQLNEPGYIFVDQHQTLYVSDKCNHRIMRWDKGAKEGILLAGGQRQGNSLTELSNPSGIYVDILKTLYVADRNNNRVICWHEGKQRGTVITGINGEGAAPNQLYYPTGISFDSYGNLYVVDQCNHRVQRFSIA